MRTKLPVTWSSSPLDALVESACLEWLNCPFLVGGNHKTGIDCSHFAGRILDRLSGLGARSSGLRCLPPHLGFQSDAAPIVRSAIRRFLEVYPELQRVEREHALAGDLLVVGPPSGGPGHIYVVGGMPGRLWSSLAGVGVSYSSFFVDPSKELLYAVYSADKSCWLSAQNTESI